jgi:hypothetical protein
LIAANRKPGCLAKLPPELGRYAIVIIQVTYSEDVTKKTDYDTISGAEYKVMNMPVSGGNAKTVLKSTKCLTLLWSRDGRHFAYTKDGAAWAASLDTPDPKQILGPTPPTRTRKPRTRPTPKRRKSQGTLLRLAGSNKGGLWIADTVTGTDELIVKMPERGQTRRDIRWSTWMRGVHLLRKRSLCTT